MYGSSFDGSACVWKRLTFDLRKRLLCLAAASGHAASLDAALAHCGVALGEELLQSAAAAGDVAACRLLLRLGCRLRVGAAKAAAARGHVPVLQLLLDRSVAPWSCEDAAVIAAAGNGACQGGQADTLAWLRQAHGYSPTAADADTAAWAGQVELLDALLPSLEPELCASEIGEQGSDASGLATPPPAAAAGSAPAWGRSVRRTWRLSLMCAILRGCPVAAAQRHYERLLERWQPLPLRPDGGVGCRGGGRCDGGGGGGRGGGGCEGQRGGGGVGAWGACHFELLVSAVSSRTPCWPAKLDLLLSRWGMCGSGALPRAWAGLGTSLACAACWPAADCRQRLERVRALGVQLDEPAVWCAVTEAGQVEALRYLWEECGFRPPGRSLSPRQVCGSRKGEPAVLRYLHDRGFRFDAERVAWEALHGASAQTLLFLAEVAVAEGGGKSREDWSTAFRRAAALGAELRVLRALRRRGADVSLAAVACGGGEEALDWAAAELEAEGRLKPLGRKEAREVFEEFGNLAAIKWLQARCLLPGQAQPLPRRRRHWCCAIS
ncbi:hypothetical protein HXX76_009611 [Chlamydomonas incerta]|uniref:Uncharacterized protein n=1 Tax=Chlamydomonas incerta TaxID=51695 RepID=A0A835SPZ0_CHLIN|nr:hypothetical protein HXX76_009611 [Chlamydomonas incerta]|eukprot:KAG2431078.1 hypothetical protein HXX76_009611 [Chlamydomonas incerta]